MAIVGDLKGISEKCVAVAGRAANEHGFVSVQSLLSQFNASLKVRPLLVEGMLARTEGDKPRWLVLVDSERYPLTEEDIANETAMRPLPPRFRFTIAHELCHTLAFAQEHGEVELKIEVEALRSRSAVVDEIEKETDRLTTLLLCPERALEERLTAMRDPISVSDLSRLANHFGLSREAFINRLLASQILFQAECWQRPQLKDFGVLLMESAELGKSMLRRWPIFKNFSDGIVPEVFHRLKSERSIPVNEAFSHHATSNAPKEQAFCFETVAGTAASPAARKLLAEVEIERVTSKQGRRSFVLVRNRAVYEKVREFERLRKDRIADRRSFDAKCMTPI